MITGSNLYQDIKEQDVVNGNNGSIGQSGKASQKRWELSWMRSIRKSQHCRELREERGESLEEELRVFQEMADSAHGEC